VTLFEADDRLGGAGGRRWHRLHGRGCGSAGGSLPDLAPGRTGQPV